MHLLLFDALRISVFIFDLNVEIISSVRITITTAPAEIAHHSGFLALLKRHRTL